MAYYVSYSECTHDEPRPGWYGVKTIDDDGSEERAGPFTSKAEALDWESDGAYSQYLEMKADERREEARDYRQEMRDAGRGHLLGDYWDD